MRSRCFLVVGDGVGASFPPALRPFGRVLRARSVAEASRVLVEERRSLTGLAVDVVLADGSGFEVLERARALEMEVPTLVVIANPHLQLDLQVNRAFTLGAAPVTAPVPNDLIVECAKRWVKAAADDEAEDERFIQEYAAETGMSVDDVIASVEGLLEKMGGRSLAELVRRVRREAIEREYLGKEKMGVSVKPQGPH